MASGGGAMTDSLVLIIGAGPTGLVLALWLTRLGVRVRIVDKTTEPGAASRAVAVQARTLELYRQVDLAEAVVEAGVKVAGATLWVGGAKAARLPLGRMGEGVSPFPYALTYPQDAHERLLMARLDAWGVHVERRTALVRFEQHPDKVRAVLQRPDGAEEICDAAYLAGCDGAHSTVREGLATGFPGGTYTGLFYVADVDAAGPGGRRRHPCRYRGRRFSRGLSPPGDRPPAPDRARQLGTGPRTPRADLRRREPAGGRASAAHDRPGALVLHLSGASPGGDALPRGTGLPAWRRGPRAQPGRRAGHEYRHRGRRESGVEARRRAARRRPRQPAGDV